MVQYNWSIILSNQAKPHRGCQTTVVADSCRAAMHLDVSSPSKLFPSKIQPFWIQLPINVELDSVEHKNASLPWPLPLSESGPPLWMISRWQGGASLVHLLWHFNLDILWCCADTLITLPNKPPNGMEPISCIQQSFEFVKHMEWIQHSIGLTNSMLLFPIRGSFYFVFIFDWLLLLLMTRLFVEIIYYDTR